MRIFTSLFAGISLLAACTAQAEYDYGIPVSALPPVETVNVAPVESLAQPDDVAPVEIQAATHNDIYGVASVAPVVHSNNMSGYVGRIEALEREFASLQTEASEASFDMVGAEQHGCCDGKGGKGWGGYAGGSWIVEAEALMVAIHRTDGLRVGTGGTDNVTPGWDIAPRLTIGYVQPDGLTFRARFFDYDHNQSAGATANFYALDAWYLDLEVADTVQLNCNWSVEMFGGFRWHDFDERMVDGAAVRRNDWIGGGITAGAIGRRAIGENRNLFGGIRGGVIYGRKQRFNTASLAESHEDAVSAFFEISGGAETTYCLDNGGLLIVKVGGENQIWTDHTSTFGSAGAAPVEGSWSGTGDLGIAMQVLSFTYVQ